MKLMLQAVAEAEVPPSPTVAQQWISQSAPPEVNAEGIEALAERAAQIFGWRQEMSSNIESIPDYPV